MKNNTYCMILICVEVLSSMGSSWTYLHKLHFFTMFFLSNPISRCFFTSGLQLEIRHFITVILSFYMKEPGKYSISVIKIIHKMFNSIDDTRKFPWKESSEFWSLRSIGFNPGSPSYKYWYMLSASFARRFFIWWRALPLDDSCSFTWRRSGTL